MTLDDLLSQSDDATIKRLILDAYRLGVHVGFKREVMMSGDLVLNEITPFKNEGDNAISFHITTRYPYEFTVEDDGA